MVQLVEDNKSFFTYLQVSQAKRACELLCALGCPSIADLKLIIKMTSIRKCTVTTRDIDIARKYMDLM